MTEIIVVSWMVVGVSLLWGLGWGRVGWRTISIGVIRSLARSRLLACFSVSSICLLQRAFTTSHFASACAAATGRIYSDVDLSASLSGIESTDQYNRPDPQGRAEQSRGWRNEFDDEEFDDEEFDDEERERERGQRAKKGNRAPKTGSKSRATRIVYQKVPKMANTQKIAVAITFSHHYVHLKGSILIYLQICAITYTNSVGRSYKVHEFGAKLTFLAKH
jgi:hypothetical protein